MRFALLSVLFCVACGSEEPASQPTPDQPIAPPPAAAPTVDMPVLPAGDQVAVDLATSKFEFVGSKITKNHPGGFNGYEGSVALNEEGIVVGTSFTVDLSSVFTDSEKLTKHLKNADFFNVEEFGKATFASSDIQAGETSHLVNGVLELRGKTKAISFPAQIVVADDKVHVTAEFDLNRQDFGVSYPGKPDDLIKDNVKIQLDLNFPRS